MYQVENHCPVEYFVIKKYCEIVRAFELIYWCFTSASLSYQSTL